MQPDQREGFLNPKTYSPYTFSNSQTSTPVNPPPSSNPSSYNQTANSRSTKNDEPFRQTDQLTFTDKNKSRPMYSSNIQFSETKSGLSLEAMGRFVDEPSKSNFDQNKFAFEQQTKKAEQNQLFKKYAEPKQKDTKMYTSGFFMNNQTNNDFDRFPAFNLGAGEKKEVETNISTGTGRTQKAETEKNKEETTEEKRRREILQIKKQLDDINKKMGMVNKGPNVPNANSFENSQFKPKNPGVAQSLIFPNSTYEPPQTNQNYMINKISPPTSNEGSLSALDKLYEQKKNQKQQNYVKQKESPIEQQNTEPKKTIGDFNIVKKQPLPIGKAEQISFKQVRPQVQETSNKISYDKPQQPQQPQTNYKYYQINKTPEQKVKPEVIQPKQTELKLPFTPQKSEETDTSQQMSFKKKRDVMIGQTLSPRSKVAEKKTLIKRIMSSEEIDENFPKPKQFKKEDFDIGKKMGKGQFGEVLLVRHKETGFICGMKIMEKKQIREENYVGQIARQLSIQFYLSHRNIAPLYGYFADEKNVYLLVEFCEGGQLLEKLRGERRMKEKDVSQIMKQVCEGVDYIHKELIIHRDIKPQNILFNHGIVKISDFGWAVYRGHGLRKTASGSPLYYPPQIVKGEQYDDKIDVWNIGMMTYECLLGKIPFRIYTEMDLDRIVSDDITFPEYVDVGDEAKDFILRSMRKKGEERMELRQMLRHPFITKQEESKLGGEILEDFRRVLS